MFHDRRDAGRELAALVARLDLVDPVVVAIPRGGVPVAAEVAAALGVDHDVVFVRKLRCPWYPRLGMGAVAEGGVRLLNRDVIDRYGVEPQDVAFETHRERALMAADISTSRTSPRVAVAGRNVVVVDDGAVTGYTARAGVTVLRAAGATRVVLAAPIATDQALRELRRVTDATIVACAVPRLDGVDSAYMVDALAHEGGRQGAPQPTAPNT